MKGRYLLMIILPAILLDGCSTSPGVEIEIYETSQTGRKLERIYEPAPSEHDLEVTIDPETEFQTITGIGGSFTEASAYNLSQLSREKRAEVMEAYFGDSGARYSLTRTHINSCDFSRTNYSYAPVPDDVALEHFSIEEDRDDLIPMIKDAMALSSEGFKIIATPWTAPPWMKDNNGWKGGKLKPEMYPVWAQFFSKYLNAYEAEGIPVWAVTVENEPLGNDSNWESMHFSPEEMNRFVKEHLGPQFRSAGQKTKILGYDQNRDEAMFAWVDAMYSDPETASFYDGMAVHWYASTFEVFPDALQYAKKAAPGNHLIQSEACIDAQVPRWNDDNWYWSKEAKDWGWDWAPADKKHLHPQYVPVFRYANDIIGCLNNEVDGWVDWNMVLNTQGGPNWAKNWCIAPVIVNPETDEVYYTPLYYTIAQFSRFIRPGAIRVAHSGTSENLKLTAVKNPDGSIVAVLLNTGSTPVKLSLKMGKTPVFTTVNPSSVQTVVLKTTTNRIKMNES